MNHPQFPTDLETKVVVHGVNVELTAALRNTAHDEAGRLLSDEPKIQRIRIDLERDADAGETGAVVAKGQMDFGGPVLFTSVTAAAPGPALAYLMQTLQHQLRRQRGRSRLDTAMRRPPAEARRPA